MNIVEGFENFVESNKLFDSSCRILLGVSGGRDSMLMSWLFLKAKCNFSIAHCNFHLRGEESDLDQQLVEAFAKENDIPVFVEHFDTESYAAANGISIQMAARELRYSWFLSLAKEEGFDRVAIAQHHNDQIETVFVNLIRGTGLKGMHGILPKKGKIIRPLLFLNAEQVIEAIGNYGILYRDDKSNFSNKYLRNKLRLDILPLFKEVEPNFEEIMRNNIARFQEEESLFEQLVEERRKALFDQQAQGYAISFAKFKEVKDNVPLLFQVFRPYNFIKSVVEDIASSFPQASGARFLSATHELLVDREVFILRRIPQGEVVSHVVIQEPQGVYSWQGGELKVELAKPEIDPSAHVAMLDLSKIQFPITLRSWQEGDYFVPLGMRGRKKISDFLINIKLSLFEKQKVGVLVNGNGEILWVVGFRIDNRYKLQGNTEKVLKLVWCNDKL